MDCSISHIFFQEECFNLFGLFLQGSQMRDYQMLQRIRTSYDSSANVVMFQIIPHQFVWIQFGRIARQIKEFEFALCGGSEFFYHLGTMRGVSVQYEKYRMRCVVNQSFEKFAKPRAIHFAVNDHESQCASGADRRDHVDAESCSCCFDNRRLPFGRPCCSCMII